MFDADNRFDLAVAKAYWYIIKKWIYFGTQWCYLMRLLDEITASMSKLNKFEFLYDNVFILKIKNLIATMI